jgi:hypothetical protein
MITNFFVRSETESQITTGFNFGLTYEVHDPKMVEHAPVIQYFHQNQI